MRDPCLPFRKLIIFNCGYFTKVTYALLLWRDNGTIIKINTFKARNIFYFIDRLKV